jgi:hypothetical protein
MFDAKLVFCKDGVLRATHYSSKIPVPLTFLQSQSKYFKNKDLAFLAQWFDNYIVFEKDTTIGSFLNCLDPWKKLWKDYLGKDVPAYILESKKPHLVETTIQPKDEKHPIHYISLNHITELSPHYETERKPGEKLFETGWLKEKRIKFTGYWRSYEHYELLGYSQNYVEHYGVSHYPLNKIVNLPFYLNDRHIILSEDFMIKNSLGNKFRLFHKDGTGVRQFRYKNRGNFHYITEKKEFTLLEAVNGFFHEFSYSPVEREEFKQHIKESLKEAFNECCNEIENPAPNNDENQDCIEQNGNLKVHVHANVYDDVFDHFEKEIKAWESITDKYVTIHKKDDIFRIGGFKEAKVPEKRIRGAMIEEADLSTGYLDKYKKKE